MHIYLQSVKNSKISICCIASKMKVRTTRMSHGRISIFVVLFQKLFTNMQKHNDCLYQAKYCMAFFPCTTCTSLSELQSIYYFYLNEVTEWGFCFSFVNIRVTQQLLIYSCLETANISDRAYMFPYIK